MPLRFPLRAACAALSCLSLLIGTGSADLRGQESSSRKAPSGPAEDAAKPVTLPADALQFAAQLADAASDSVKKWCRSAARKNGKSEKALKVDGIHEAVAAKFSGAGVNVRDALVFLAVYQGYLAASEDQAGAAALLRGTDRDIRTVESRLRMARIGSEDRWQNQLATLELQRRVQAASVEAAGKEVDKYLSALARLYPPVKDTDPALLRSLP
jgi:hypothetical protein